MTAPDEQLDASGLRLAIVAARFNADITERLLDGALTCLKDAGAPDVPVEWVPGAFELPLAARALAQRDGVDGIVALGCVIRGETPHFHYVAGEAARGLMDVMLETGIPVAFGVLTTDTTEQAETRAGGAAGNKGWDAAATVIQMARLLRRITAPERP